jgi:hypothetical protein
MGAGRETVVIGGIGGRAVVGTELAMSFATSHPRDDAPHFPKGATR